MRNAQGTFDATSWDLAEAELLDRLRPVIEGGRGTRIAFVSELITGTLQDLTRHWLSELGQPDGPILYEPFAYGPLAQGQRDRLF